MPIDLFGPFELLDTTSASDGAYSRFEGAFYGNLFDSDPKAFVCTEAQHSCDQMRGCRSEPDGTCNCGVLGQASPGSVSCRDGFGEGGAGGASCYYWWADDAGTRYYLSDCTDASARAWSTPVTVWFAPRANGTSCRYDGMCASWACNGGTCVAKALNGATCDSAADCQCGSCEAGFCGLATGTACANDGQCRSNLCRKNVCR